MKISISAIKFLNSHYNSAGDPAPEGVGHLVQRIGERLGAVEEIIPFGERFNDIIVVKIVNCQPHPNADKLNLCHIDDGGKVKDVPRGADGLVQVICGAPNARAGILAAWLPPGAVVPETFDGEQFKIGSKELRGVLSHGMLASLRELALGSSHDGILEIQDSLAPGTSLASAYHLDGDVVLDIENKMFTHRPDCFGWLGIAREIAGIYGQAYKSPSWYVQNPDFPPAGPQELKLQVKNELPSLVPRFTAVAISNVKVGPSPLWLQADLARMGIKPINNIVDYTNFYMVLTGQPLHAYDYDKLLAQDSGASRAALVVRHPKKGEKLTLLGGKLIEPRPEAIVIATRDRLVGIGGVMGGAETEVSPDTKNIVLECGTFDMYSVRRTSMFHGLFTDAAARFTKGQSPLQNLAVLNKIASQICDFAGGKIASSVIDLNHVSPQAMERGSVHPPVNVSAGFINQRLGLNLAPAQISKLLTNVEFKVEENKDSLTVVAPFWRTDISIPEDIVEEVGRLHGYDHLPLELPLRSLTPAVRNPMLELKRPVRESLAKTGGANEILTYSFVHGRLLNAAGQDPAQAFSLSNALSPSLQYYRLSLTPSILEKIHPNIKAGYKSLALFEMNPVHSKLGDSAGQPPTEYQRLALVVAASSKTAFGQSADAYYLAKSYLDLLADRLGLELDYSPLADGSKEALLRPFLPGRAAVIHARGQFFGVVGEYQPATSKALKLPSFCGGFEIDLEVLLAQFKPQTAYRQLEKFPSITQDVCFRLARETPYSQLHEAASRALDLEKDISARVEPLDIYQEAPDSQYKNITLRIILKPEIKTLTTDEANEIAGRLADQVRRKLGAERV